MNILFVDYEYPPLGGGGGVVTQMIAKQLAQRGHNIHIVTTRGPELDRFEDDSGVSIHRVPCLRRSQAHSPLLPLLLFPITSLRAMWAVCRTEKIDVINAHFIVPSAVSAAILARVLRIPLVTSAFGADLYDPSRYRRLRSILNRVCRYVMNRSQLVVCPSSDMVERARQLTRTRVSRVPHGVDTSFFGISKSSGILDRLGVAGRPTVLSVARLVRRKAFETALEAIAVIKEEIPDVLFVLGGEGPDEARLRSLVGKLNLEDNVLFTGRVEQAELAPLYSAANVFVLPSTHEAFGVVLLESLACGTPVVVSRIGGMTDIVEPGRNGYTCAIGDTGGFGRALLKVLKDDSWETARPRIRAGVERKYAWPKVADSYESVFEAELEARTELTPGVARS